MNKELKKLEELLANDRKIIEDNYKEIERLHSIIKEVREYIKKHTNYDNCDSKNHLDLTDRDNILEILDKAGDEK